MRRRVLEIVSAAILTAALAVPAGAQTSRSSSGPVPDTGMTAVGISVGAAVPGEKFFRNGVDLGVDVSHYFTPRVSARGQVSGAWWDIFGHTYHGTARPLAFNGNVVYNWEGGVIHPYVTGGFGLYHYRFTEGATDSSDTKFGVDVGGGVEYFLTREDTITGELLVHAVPGNASGRANDYTAHYWSLAVGYRKYFGGK